MSVLQLRAQISDVQYSPRFDVNKTYPSYDLDTFDVNNASSSGLINTDAHSYVTYAKWSSPKRTRSYPFARLYDAFKKDSIKIAIIPIIKDEGKDSPNNDRINAITLSWMNLLNIHIILAHYTSAEKKPGRKNLITNQLYDNNYVNQKIRQILDSKKDAYDWNVHHFKSDFVDVYNNAISNYQKISKSNDVFLHSKKDHISTLEKYLIKDTFDLDSFYKVSNKRSKGAQKREATSISIDGSGSQKRASINIKNHKGGLYFLTVENLISSNDKVIIQEEIKTSSRIIPTKQAIKDALFKLILYSNISQLYINNKEVKHITKLVIKGNFKDHLSLPMDRNKISQFSEINGLTVTEQSQLIDLYEESSHNSVIVELLSNYVIHREKDLTYHEFNRTSYAKKSPLRYPGGKTRALKSIIPNIPHFSEFREPFVGGGSVFLTLNQITRSSKKVIINDLNYDLFCFWSTLKNNGVDLVKSIQDVWSHYSDGKKLYSDYLHLHSDNDFDRAVRFFIMNRITFSGLSDSGGYSEESYKKRFTQSSINRLRSTIPLMKNVEVYHGDYRQIIELPGKDVFIFLDPPYVSARESRLYGKNGDLHSAFNHEQFAEVMKDVEHKWLITYDDTVFIRELFDFAYQYEWSVQYGMNNVMQTSAEKGNELFISNYPLPLKKGFIQTSL